jgi:hypothetical protein
MKKIKFKPRCKTCAFTAGTPANKDEITRLKAELCVIAYQPFFCHSNAVEDKIPEGKERLCAGWAESVAGKPYPPEWKRRIALESLKQVIAAEDGKELNAGAIITEMLCAP